MSDEISNYYGGGEESWECVQKECRDYDAKVSIGKDVLKKKLCDSLCQPMYGMNLWLSLKKTLGAFNQLATA